MRTTLRRARTALVTGGLGLAMAAAAASPASAASFVTPRYGMTCETGVSGSFGSYNGYATCYTPVVAKWKVRVDCSSGGTYDSILSGPPLARWWTHRHDPACSSDRSTSLPPSTREPARTSATRRGAFTARQRAWADSMSFSALTSPAALERGP
jgi:hypothetical protein